MGSPIKGYRIRGLTALSAVCVAGFVLAACAGSGYQPGEPQMDAHPAPDEDRSGGIFGRQGLLLFNTEDPGAQGNDATYWGFGVVQILKDYATELYAQFSVVDLDDTSSDTYDDIATGMFGARVKF